MKWTEKSATECARRMGCHLKKVSLVGGVAATFIELPKDGPGIRAWGALDYLSNHAGWMLVRP